MESKPTVHENPKDIVGSTKMSLSLCPDTLPAYASLAYLEGALKYGRYNWRKAGVSASIYIDAAKRHMDKYWNGEWADPKTKIPHLASVLGSIGIILDAHLCGKLKDDRPPAAPVSEFIEGQAELIAHLKETFKDHSPHQYTIAD